MINQDFPGDTNSSGLQSRTIRNLLHSCKQERGDLQWIRSQIPPKEDHHRFRLPIDILRHTYADYSSRVDTSSTYMPKVGGKG